ncbi:uncharacterized protein N7477_008200 [Penicillium maclennaniae]|uniref:uncharacterized protein n=1 Tax=Penicillium maclennaniae TaxID=1343394 RepID=UPI0025406229|nr:uncharacterized protein N7477_008200 [Penicillium maclennaniae]KAJ5665752.1 hypothetical protein N7477_008200 [Penicillium maclennaniae]
MAAPRHTSLRALRQLSQQPIAAPARRGLHITGVQSAQPANPADKASLYAARSLPDLKTECQRRSLRAAGSKSELIERLSNHDVLQSLNPLANSTHPAPPKQLVTPPQSISVYMPIMSDMETRTSRLAQIPVLSDLYSHHESTSPSAPPMKPQIYTVSGAGVVAASPMSEVVDNHSVDIDPFSLTEAVDRSRVGEEVQRRTNGKHTETGIIKELWTGFLDDVLGPKEVARK